MRIKGIASNAKYRKVFEKKSFENLRNFENLLIFKFANSERLLKFWQFRKLSNLYDWNFFLNLQNLLIKKNFKNPKNIKFRILKKFECSNNLKKKKFRK